MRHNLGCLDQVSGGEHGEKWLNSRQILKVERTGCANGSSGCLLIIFSFNVVVKGKLIMQLLHFRGHLGDQ